MLRNAIYHVSLNKEGQKKRHRSSAVEQDPSRYQHYLIPKKGIHNNTFYSFGGKRPLSAAVDEPTLKPIVNPVFADITQRSSVRANFSKGPYIYRKEPKVNIVDYTKNVS